MDHSTSEDVVTMLDVLREEKEINEQANAVLSGSDESKCTYFNGYVKRQALYSCLTCQPNAKTDPNSAIGICLACSNVCHNNHELIELYTKRNFRCDCGVKQGSTTCQLVPTKKIREVSASSSSSSTSRMQPNERNRYNKNFSGIYCTCNRPYPDEEDDIEDVMIQCVICENWYHTRHLGSGKVPEQNAYSEMICDVCMQSNDFLQDYNGLAVESVDPEDSKIDASLNVTSLDESVVDESATKKIKLSDDACVRPTISLNDDETSIKATFWKDGWRKNLCKCVKCTKLYESKNISFLLDEEDTVHYYEEKGKDKQKSNSYDEGLEALSNLSRVNQIDAISGYNKMKEKLFEFLQTFVKSNKIVTEDDIKKFFSSMKDSNENQNVSSPPFNCR